jgi:hypothetical protein
MESLNTLKKPSDQVQIAGKIRAGWPLTVSNVPGGVYIIAVKDAGGIDKKIRVRIQN